MATTRSRIRQARRSTSTGAQRLTDRARALAERAGDGTTGAARQVRSAVVAHPVATTVALAALVGAVAGIFVYRHRR